ncbi:MAG: LptF/LptG family permease [Tannerellaceae bacterium]|jgi:lipopolysaccharide export system permease protein|nr:LptF/LptG family permease [Tannerellaceae bacterium]
MKRLYTFVLQTFLPVFVMTFGICLFIVLMQFIWRYIDDMVGKGLELSVLVELFFYAALFLVPMALPLSILLASLMTFGNLGERLELLAMKSAGVSLLRIMRPLIILVTCISVGAFFFQNNVLPVAQVKLWGLLFSVRQKSPELDIPQGAFYGEITGFNLYVKEKNKDGLLMDMMIYDYSGGFNNARVIVADSGRLKMSVDKKFLILTLYTGESFENLRQENPRNRLHPASVPYRRETFGSKEILIDFDANFTRIDDSFLQNEYMGKNLYQLQLSINSMTASLDSVREVNARALTAASYRKTLTKDSLLEAVGKQVIPFDSLICSGVTPYKDVLIRARNVARDIKDQNALRVLSFSDESARVRRYFTEWHKKFTVSVACLLFFFIGAPLGAIIRKGGLGLPVILSIFLFIFYYILDNVGLKMARNGIWPVWQGMWLSATALAVFGTFLTWKAVRDSVIINIETYLGVFKRLGGHRTFRKIERKEVVIYPPDYEALSRRLVAFSEACRSCADIYCLFPPFFHFWEQKGNDHGVTAISVEMEELIEILRNSDRVLILNKLMDFPVLTGYSHPVFRRSVTGRIFALLLPVSLPLYIFFVYRRRYLRQDLRTVRQVTNELLSLFPK